MRFLSQGHAEDVILWHRYNYYVLGVGLLPDLMYDELERAVGAVWSVNVCATVGSSDERDYPSYVREQRRPDALERAERDRRISLRWMDSM